MQINLEAAKNEDAMKLAISGIRRTLDHIYMGGGKKKIEKTMKFIQ